MDAALSLRRRGDRALSGPRRHADLRPVFVAARRGGRADLRRAPQGLWQSGAVDLAADLDDRLAPAQGPGHRVCHRPRRAAGRGRPARGAGRHHPVQFRRRQPEPQHGAGHAQRRAVDPVPAHPTTAALGLRGQWLGDLAQHAQGLGGERDGPSIATERSGAASLHSGERAGSAGRLRRRQARDVDLSHATPTGVLAPQDREVIRPRRLRSGGRLSLAR